MSPKAKHINWITAFYVALTCLACSKNEIQIIEEWDDTTNDSYIEFYEDSEAFIETNEAGVVGGKLFIQLSENQFFVDGVEENVVFNNFLNDLEPVVIVNDTKNRLQISISGRTVEHAEKNSIYNISIRIPEIYISGKNKEEVELQNVKILFHDVACTWKSPITSNEYLLVFNDEFNGSEIDRNRWKFRAGTAKITRTIQYNNEDYDIVVEDEASVLEDGNMVLKVYKKDDEPNKIFTGGILTLDKFMPRYGYYETMVSFKDCNGFGHWPAFWLHFSGEDKNTTGTEIDIFEYINNSQTIFQTLHWYIGNEHLSSSENFVLNKLDEYHKFGLEWTPEELIFYVDGKVTRHLKNSEIQRYVPDAYQMVYYSMSAGIWGGNVADPSNKLPASSKFDYCRVYQSTGHDAFYKFGDGEKLIDAENRMGNY